MRLKGDFICNVLNSGVEEILVGQLVDSNPTGDFPREARVFMDAGACLTQYLTETGDRFSAGAGYLIIP